jgi:hypothetical protein
VRERAGAAGYHRRGVAASGRGGVRSADCVPLSPPAQKVLVDGRVAAPAGAPDTQGAGFALISEGHKMGMSTPDRTETLFESRSEMAAEGRRIVDAARKRGLTLRLIGGLAVRDHCEELSFCGRDHSDLDMVGLSHEVVGLIGLFETLGYRERIHVREATMRGQAQFMRECVHGSADGAYAVHAEDHVDVFLDEFRMDHRVDLRHRLGVERYTVSASDLLLTKLQVFRAEERDLRDIVTLLKDDGLGSEDAPGTVSVAYLAELCARDWGLYYDVVRNLRRCAESLGAYGLGPADEDHVRAALAQLTEAIEAGPKTRAWRWRARVGTRRRWHEEVEEQDDESLGGTR